MRPYRVNRLVSPPWSIRRKLLTSGAYWPLAPRQAGVIAAADAQASIYRGPTPPDLTPNNSPTRGTGHGNIPDAVSLAVASTQSLSVSGGVPISRKYHVCGWFFGEAGGFDADFSESFYTRRTTANECELRWTGGGTLQLNWFVWDGTASLRTAVNAFDPIAETWYFVDAYIDLDEGNIGVRLNLGTYGTNTITSINTGSTGTVLGQTLNGRMGQWIAVQDRLTDQELAWLYNDGRGNPLTVPLV